MSRLWVIPALVLFAWACPRPTKTIETITFVPSICKLPPGPGELPAPARVKTDACPANLVCFDIPNAAKLAERDSILKSWVREAKVRCNPLDAGPPDARLSQ